MSKIANKLNQEELCKKCEIYMNQAKDKIKSIPR